MDLETRDCPKANRDVAVLHLVSPTVVNRDNHSTEEDWRKVKQDVLLAIVGGRWNPEPVKPVEIDEAPWSLERPE